MKKKLLLSVVLAALCSFIITGCGSSDDDGPAPLAYTPVDLESPDTLVGTYEIDYFLSSATISTLTMEITSDCDYAKQNLGAVSCEPSANASMKGMATITKNGDKYSVTTKIQLWGGIFEDPVYGSMAASSKYNYTAYAPVNADSIDAVNKNINKSGTVVEGVESRNMIEMTSDSAASFSFSVDAGGNIVSTIDLSSPVPTVTKVVLRKVSNDSGNPLDPNTLVDDSIAGFAGNFDNGVWVTVPDMAKPETLVGTYNISYFGTVADREGNPFAIISTDCDKMKQSDLGIQYADTMSMCSAGTQILGGKLVVEEKDGNLYATSKLQMYGPYFKTMGALAANDTYQVTVYEAVPVTNPSNAGTGAVVGVTGRNLIENTWNRQSPFEFSINSDGTFHVSMTLKDKSVLGGMLKLDAHTRVDAVKVNNNPSTLDPNVLFVENYDDGDGNNAFSGFVANPTNVEN